MSPVATPPQEEYQASATSPSPKLAFETLLADAFLVREQTRVKTNQVLMALDLMVAEQTKVV